MDVSLELEDGKISLAVRDYGKGLSAEMLESFGAMGSNLGVGLTGMRERILELGGKLEIVSQKPGLLVRVAIPTGDRRLEKTRPFKASGEDGSAA